jgi:hypothetical protein
MTKEKLKALNQLSADIKNIENIIQHYSLTMHLEMPTEKGVDTISDKSLNEITLAFNKHKREFIKALTKRLSILRSEFTKS